MVAARCTGAAERLVAEMTAFARLAASPAASPSPRTAWWRAMLADSVTELFAARSMLYEDRAGHRPRPIRREDRARPSAR